ncbi:hypothetical protein ONZ45_g5560 [Pleurotus djamor]|nr:hypothetical protein ONZ45_g5560 [Pleurotus djamor]
MQSSGPSFASLASTQYSTSSSNPFSSTLGSSDSLHGRLGNQGPDPNSTETFKENLQLIYQHFQQLRVLSRKVQMNTRDAYSRQISPYQAEADLATLRHFMQNLIDLLRQSGVGALPFLAADSAAPQTEDELIHSTTASVKVLFEQLKRKQENAGNVAGLLSLPASAQMGMMSNEVAGSTVPR